MTKKKYLFYSACGTLFLITFFLVSRDFQVRGSILADILSATDSGGQSASSTTDGMNNQSTSTIIDVLQNMQDQVEVLTVQIAELHRQVQSEDFKRTFTRVLRRGDSGSDVSKLQEILNKLSDIPTASSTVTGFYGKLTVAAVKSLQENNGLRSTGVFDEATNSRLYKLLMAENASSSEGFSPIDLSSVPDLENHSLSAALDAIQSRIDQLASDTEASVSDLQSQISDLTQNLNSQQASNIPADTYSSAAPAAPQALSISGVQAVNVTKTSSTISWTTNNAATSKVSYSSNSSMSASGTLTVESSAMVTSHSLNISKLNPGTTYYYWVLSTDANSSTASSTKSSFRTQS